MPNFGQSGECPHVCGPNNNVTQGIACDHEIVSNARDVEGETRPGILMHGRARRPPAEVLSLNTDRSLIRISKDRAGQVVCGIPNNSPDIGPSENAIAYKQLYGIVESNRGQKISHQEPDHPNCSALDPFEAHLIQRRISYTSTLVDLPNPSAAHGCLADVSAKSKSPDRVRYIDHSTPIPEGLYTRFKWAGWNVAHNSGQHRRNHPCRRLSANSHIAHKSVAKVVSYNRSNDHCHPIQSIEAAHDGRRAFISGSLQVHFEPITVQATYVACSSDDLTCGASHGY